MPDVQNRDWMLNASCREHDPETFFPDPGDRRGQVVAHNICRDCPVRDACGQYAQELGVSHGMWGGEYRNDRHSRAEAGFHRKPCGTIAAYRRHHRNHETPCHRCVFANSIYQAQKRRAANG